MKKIVLNLLGSFLVLLSVNLTANAQNCTISSNAIVGDGCTFGSSGTLTVEAGVTATIQLWGAGGGGGSLAATPARAGGGGGGYTTVSYVLTAGTYTVVVGAGGVAGANGTASSIAGTGITTATAAGGARGAGGGGGAGGVGATRTGGAGGAGGPNGGGGGGGEGACTTANGAAGTAGSGGVGGVGGTGCDGGDGGAGGSSGQAGNNGSGIGSGGGGRGSGGTVSGSGGAGQVIVTVSTAPLPVTLTYFTVKSSQLFWQTAMELNNDRFEIERLLEGENEFSQIGEVIGAGNSNSLVNYSFSDESAVPAGNHCYRLKQVDFDGQYEYSEVQCVSLKGEKAASIYPNPFTNEIIIADYATEMDTEVEVSDLQGNVLIRASLDQEVKHISTAELAPGTYFVRVSGTVKKIVKY